MEIVCRLIAYRRFKSSSLRHKKGIDGCLSFFMLSNEYRRVFEGGSRFARAKRFANASTTTINSTAKDAIENGGAGQVTR